MQGSRGNKTAPKHFPTSFIKTIFKISEVKKKKGGGGKGYSFLNMNECTSNVCSFHFNVKSRAPKLQSPNALDVLKIIENKIKLKLIPDGKGQGGQRKLKKINILFYLELFLAFHIGTLIFYPSVCYD